SAMTTRYFMKNQRSIANSFVLAAIILAKQGASAQQPAAPANSPTNSPSGLNLGVVNSAANAQDRQQMMELLKITSLRPGRNGGNPQATNYANYDESKANPFPELPAPLRLKSGQKVTTPAQWWNRRRAEIVEDFDREIYGRVPMQTPHVEWEVTGTTETNN